MRRLWRAATAALALAACAAGERLARYTCEDGSSLSVRFSADGNEASVEHAGPQPLVLPRQVAGSGFLYETPQYSLRGKGDEALWTVGRRAPVRCQLLTAPAVSPPTM